MKPEKELQLLKKDKIARLQMKVYQQNPDMWLEERFGERIDNFRWSDFKEYKDHKWDGDVDTLWQAWLSVIKEYTWVAIEAGVGTSKTYFLSRLVLWFVDVFENATVYNFAPTAGQLRDNLWKEVSRAFPKFKKIRPNAELLSFELRVDARDVESYEGDSYGWGIVCKSVGVGSAEDSATAVQGIHGKDILIILEETPGIHNAVITALKTTAVAPNNTVIAVGNPDNTHDTLHQFAKLSNVDNYRLSALDYPNVICKDPLKFAGGVTQNSINNLIKEYGETSDFYQRRVRGISPAQSKDSLIKVEWFDECVDKNPEVFSYNAAGVDVARSERGDKAAVAYGKGAVLRYIKDFQCPNASHLAYNIMYNNIELLQHGYSDYDIPTAFDYGVYPENIGVDGVGVGVSTVEAFAEKGLDVTSLTGGFWKEAVPKDEQGNPLYTFVSLRAQMYWEAREDLRRGLVGIMISDNIMLSRLRKEITAVKQVPSASGIKLEDKETLIKRIGYSPNLADAFVYWNWIRKGYRNGITIDMPFG